MTKTTLRALPSALACLLFCWHGAALGAPKSKAAKKAATDPLPSPVVEVMEAPAPPAPAPSEPAPRSAPVVPKTDDRIPVAIMDVTGSSSLAPELLTTLGDVIPQELNDTGLFRTISRADLLEMIRYEERKQLLGCDDPSCMTDLGSALGADYVISGSVTLLGELYVLQFRLVKTSASRVVQRVSREYRGNVTGLLGEMRVVSKMLVRDLTATHAGTLRVRASEEGATVKVDGTIVGVTPLADLAIAGGIHILTVEKQSFVLFTRDVQVTKEGVTEVDVLLVPSEEYRREYVAAAQRTRLRGWLSVGLGVAGAAGSFALYRVAGAESESLRTDVAAFNAEPAGRTKEQEAVLNGRRRRLGLLESGSVGSAVLGVAALTTGIVLLVTGDDPHKFDAIPTKSGVSFGVAPGNLWAQARF